MNKIDRIKELTKELLLYCHEYYDLDAPTISDAEYDKKFDTLMKLEDEANFWLANSPTRKVQGEVLPYLEKVRHSVPMLSADKSTNIEDVIRFKGDKMIMASYKLDGSTVVLKYNEGKLYQGLSRGSGVDGENITHTVKMIKNIPMTIPYKGYLEIRGEALIPWDYYNEMNKDNSLGHPRNVASGALRQLDANEVAKRNIYFYAFTLVNWREVCSNANVLPMKSHTLNFLSYNGFSVVPHYSVPAFDTGTELTKIINLLDRKSYNNPTDGWCFEYENLEYGESLGSTGHHDRRLFALKPEVEEYGTTLRDVEWTLGKTGQLTPTAIFDPTEIDNTIVTKASVHNLSVMKNLGLKIGGKCFIHKANMIIPQVLRCVDGDSAIEIPKYCTVCGGKTEVVKENESEVLMCTNPNCSGKLLGRLKYFVSRSAANIDGMSEAIIDFLINKNWIKSFKDIYHLSDYKNEWQNCDGFGKKSVEKILNSIEKSRNIKLENFITALSIPDVGLSTAKTIAARFDDCRSFIIRATDFEWEELDGIGSVTAEKIKNFISTNLDEIRELAKEFNFIEEDKIEIKANPFNGKSVAVTGKLIHFTRDTINAKLESLGAKPASGVTAKTHYLINNDPTSGSSKNKKANELSIPIITENEFLEMIGE